MAWEEQGSHYCLALLLMLQSSKSRTAPFHGDDSWCNSGLECQLKITFILPIKHPTNPYSTITVEMGSGCPPLPGPFFMKGKIMVEEIEEIMDEDEVSGGALPQGIKLAVEFVINRLLDRAYFPSQKVFIDINMCPAKQDLIISAWKDGDGSWDSHSDPEQQTLAWSKVDTEFMFPSAEVDMIDLARKIHEYTKLCIEGTVFDIWQERFTAGVSFNDKCGRRGKHTGFYIYYRGI